MASNFNDVLKQGYVRMRSRKLGIYRRCWLVFRKSSSKGPCRLEKYPEEKAAYIRTSPKVTDMSHVKSITRLPRDTKRQAVTIVFTDDTSAPSADWYKSLSVECLGCGLNDISLGEPDLLAAGVQCEHTERFHVFLLPSSNLDIYGECMMQVTQENITCGTSTTPAPSFHLAALRLYFIVFCRMCDSGEGLYTFQTSEGEHIYQRVHTSTLSIAEQHKKVLLEMEKNNRESPAEPYPCVPTPILPRSAYWHHITGTQSSSEPSGTTSSPLFTHPGTQLSF
uniref:Docking protein 4-like n=1 Tax=Gouania willdenowi TaxID=441366 RepID=A0A8C5GKF1_GOUWI